MPQSGQSAFETALESIHISPRLLEGVPVWQVSFDGKFTPCLLKLGVDKFTVHILEYQLSKPSKPSILRFRARSSGSLQQSSSGTDSQSNTSIHPYYSNSHDVTLSRLIDVGAIDRIQRGGALNNDKTLNNSCHTPKNINNDDSSNNGPQVTPHRSFSIIFRGEPTLDLLATDSSMDREDYLNTLDQIINTYKLAKDKVANDVLLLRYVWLDIITMNKKNNTGTVDVNQVAQILDRINLSMKKQQLKKMYEQFGKVIGLDRGQRKKGLTLSQCITFLHKIKRDSWVLKPVNVLWNKLFGEFMNNGKQRMTVSDKTFLDKFLHRKQGQIHATIEDVRIIFQKLNQLEVKYVADTGVDPNDNTRIDKERFEAYLYSTANDAFDPMKQKFDPLSMTKPISEYWINSSHNTYLTGDQFISQSKVEMYSHALYRGCRCIELDIWDGDRVNSNANSTNSAAANALLNQSEDNNNNQESASPKDNGNNTAALSDTASTITTSNVRNSVGGSAINNSNNNNDGTPVPVVYHGHTMTTKILFVDIIKAIKLFLNFHPDTFPIILSFENHCSIPYQEVMAEQVLRILGDSLYIPTDLNSKLPSPMDLRGMVVIKGKRPNSIEAEFDESDNDDSDDERQAATGTVSAIGTSVTSYDNYSTTGSSVTNTTSATAKRMHHKVSPALARLTTFHGCKHKNWEDSLMNPTYYMHSFSENKVRSMCKQQQRVKKWAIYNQSHMTRTYPAGSRVDSSNYSPYLAWSTGCQMVALNYQTNDAYLRANDGRFRENGNCGYVLKPSEIMQKYIFATQRELPDRFGIANSSYDEPFRFSVRVLSGSCIPKPKGSRIGDCINPYVKVSVFDVKDTEKEGKKESITSYQTTVCHLNGLFPIWNHQDSFSFQVENQCVAILQLIVYDKNMSSTGITKSDEFIASSSIPISCLRKGIRSVKLFDANNTTTGAFDFASLLIDIKYEQKAQEI